MKSASERQEKIPTPPPSIEVPEPTGIYAEPWSSRKLMGLLASFGPAAIVASVSVGAGETIVVVRAGAWAGYGLLWLVLLSAITKGLFVTYLMGRYPVMSGEGIANRLVRLPGPRGWFLFLIMGLELAFAPFGWVPIAKPCGDLSHYLLTDYLPAGIDPDVYRNLFTMGIIALAISLSFGTSFKGLERQQIFICGILVGGTVAGTLLVRPDFLEALKGILSIGHVPQFPEWAPPEYKAHPVLNLARDYGYVGGSVFAYVVYASWVRMHKWGLTGSEEIDALGSGTHPSAYLPTDPASVRRARLLAAPLRWDAGMGALVLFIVTAAFMMSGAAVLYPLKTEFTGWNLLTNQAYVWRNIHPALVWIYYITIAAALWGTLQALPEVYTRVTSEFLTAIYPERNWSFPTIQKTVVLWIFLGTTALVWRNVSFDTVSQIAGLILANLSIALIMMAALYLNFQLPRAYRTRWYMLAGGIVTSVILVIASSLSAWGLFLKFFMN